MQTLKTNEFVNLSASVVRLLTQNRIITILDFLQEDVSKLTAITKLTLPQILSVRNEIFEKFSVSNINGSSLLDTNNLLSKKFRATGISRLDTLLEGGIPSRYITEICGLADSGKTQLCLQLVIHCTKTTENSVLYVDTKGDFSAVRIQKVLEATGHSHKEMADIMSRVRVVHLWNLKDTIDLLLSLKNKTIEIENLAMIIIDSLPCLLLQHHGDENKTGLSMLNTLVNYSRCLCKEQNLSIIFVNIQTRWVDQDVAEFDDDGENSVMKEMYVEKRNRCLGKYWQLIPSLVLLLEKLQDNEEADTAKIVLSVMKSNNVKILSRQCTLYINAFGVT